MAAKNTQARAGCSSDVGRARDHNEDSWLCSDPAPDEQALQLRGRLYVVADGMGGHAAGEVASRVAVETIVGEYQAMVDADVAAGLGRALQAANAEVYRQAHTRGQEGMGTTAVCAVVRGSELYLAHIGDSRAYLLRGDDLRQLTQDHTLVNEQVRHGILTPAEAKDHPQRHIISRALGARPEATPEISGPLRIQAGDVVLLCSDGICGYVDDEQIAYTLRTNRDDPQVAADMLTQLADAAGGHDNATAIVIRLDKVVPSPRAIRRPRDTMPLAGGPEPLPEPPAARHRVGRGLVLGVAIGLVAGLALAAAIWLSPLPRLMGWSPAPATTAPTVTPTLPPATVPTPLPMPPAVPAPPATAVPVQPAPTETPSPTPSATATAVPATPAGTLSPKPTQ